MDNNGNHIWSVSYGGGGYDYGNEIDVDSFGNIWVIGSFRNTVDLIQVQEQVTKLLQAERIFMC